MIFKIYWKNISFKIWIEIKTLSTFFLPIEFDKQNKKNPLSLSIDFRNPLDWSYFLQSKIDVFSPQKSKLRPDMEITVKHLAVALNLCVCVCVYACAKMNNCIPIQLVLGLFCWTNTCISSRSRMCANQKRYYFYYYYYFLKMTDRAREENATNFSPNGIIYLFPAKSCAHFFKKK